MKPTIHITNWSSRKLHHGHVYTIMAKPRRWERGEGAVTGLVPNANDLASVRAESITVAEYRRRFLDGWTPERTVSTFRPGRVMASTGNGLVALADGDTLCCACSRDAAARGECHRVWAAELLRQAGWRVVLDGVDTEGTNAP